MRILIGAAFTFGMLLSGPSAGRADEQQELRAVIDKAIKAVGGEAKIEKNSKAATWKGKGSIHAMGAAIPYTAEVAIAGFTKSRVQVDGEVDNVKFSVVIVYDGKQGWRKISVNNMDMLMELTKEQLNDQREEAHANQVSSLLPLKGKEFTLSSLGDVKVNDRPAVGIKVSHKGCRDINLYFDKESHLLIKTERRVRDEMADQEVNQETFFSAYKDFDGYKQYTKIDVKRDGKQFVDMEVSDYKAVDKLDDNLFMKP